MSKLRWSIEQKRQHVADWRASGLTRQQYCELNDIPFTNGRRMLQKLNAGKINRQLFTNGLVTFLRTLI
uniref:IS66 family insertion sequence element accessory protein TnpA n=1 Tax=Salmonella enterica TaxID=28901 RepID=UPI003A8F0CE5